jgi:hypothetical protein
VYLNARHSALRPRQWWSDSANVEAIALQHAQREDIRGAIADALERFKAGRWQPAR